MPLVIILQQLCWFNAVALFGLPRFLSLPVALLLPQLFHWEISKVFFFFFTKTKCWDFFLYRCQTFHSSSWVETLSKLTFFLSSLCHLSCNLFLGHFPDVPAGLQLCRMTISFSFLHADVTVSRKCGFLHNWSVISLALIKSSVYSKLPPQTS